MALLITDPKAEQAVIALAQATGESVDGAITQAAEARLNPYFHKQQDRTRYR